MKTARHSGKVGDIIFSLPVVKKLGIDVLFIPERTGEVEHLYSNVKSLLLEQPYLQGVAEYASDLPYMETSPDFPPIDYDLDLHRTHMAKGSRNMVQRYADVFNVEVDTSPWLVLNNDVNPSGYNLVNVTPRHRGGVDWNRVLAELNTRDLPVLFIGTQSEHEVFVSNIGPIPYLFTKDLYTFASAINSCEALYCNQSAALSIAQALGKEYYLELKPGKTNCLFRTPNEHLL